MEQWGLQAPVRCRRCHHIASAHNSSYSARIYVNTPRGSHARVVAAALQPRWVAPCRMHACTHMFMTRVQARTRSRASSLCMTSAAARLTCRSSRLRPACSRSRRRTATPSSAARTLTKRSSTTCSRCALIDFFCKSLDHFADHSRMLHLITTCRHGKMLSGRQTACKRLRSSMLLVAHVVVLRDHTPPPRHAQGLGS
jgi:hypothetical protein